MGYSDVVTESPKPLRVENNCSPNQNWGQRPEEKAMGTGQSGTTGIQFSTNHALLKIRRKTHGKKEDRNENPPIIPPHKCNEQIFIHIFLCSQAEMYLKSGKFSSCDLDSAFLSYTAKINSLQKAQDSPSSV
jgi:hypothetical protein